jgi:hypothetical protein
VTADKTKTQSAAAALGRQWIADHGKPEGPAGSKTVSTARSFTMKDRRKAYEEKLDAQLQEWNAQIALLRARADKAKAGAKLEYHKTIEALQRRQDEAGAKLHKLKNAGDEAWEDMKTGAEKAWDEVKAAFHAAMSKFK